MSPIADAAFSAQQRRRADTDVVWLARLPPPLSDPGKAFPSHSAVRSCCTRGSACPCAACACAPQHGGRAGRISCWSWVIWLPLNSGSLLELIFSPSNPSLSGPQYFLETCNVSGHFCLLRRIDVWVVICINSLEEHWTVSSAQVEKDKHSHWHAV